MGATRHVRCVFGPSDNCGGISPSHTHRTAPVCRLLSRNGRKSGSDSNSCGTWQRESRWQTHSVAPSRNSTLTLTFVCPTQAIFPLSNRQLGAAFVFLLINAGILNRHSGVRRENQGQSRISSVQRRLRLIPPSTLCAPHEFESNPDFPRDLSWQEKIRTHEKIEIGFEVRRSGRKSRFEFEFWRNARKSGSDSNSCGTRQRESR